MCPLSALMQFWVAFTALLLLCQGTVSQLQKAWGIKCDPVEPTVSMYDIIPVTCNVTGPDIEKNYVLLANSENENILKASSDVELKHDPYDDYSVGNFNITGNFLGKTKVTLKVKELSRNVTLYEDKLNVIVIRKKRIIDTVFTASVATLVSIIYINFGCALNWEDLRMTLRRPIGPVIGFIAQYLFMPLLSYGLGKLLFPDNPEMQLGMFFTGVSPAGGASNMWTVILGGNINLSITMTTISTFAAFGMMPFWLFTLGRQIFHDGDIPVPYKEISTYAIALVVPLFIGYLIQKYMKNVGRFFARILKGFSSVLMICIIVFAIVTNLYLFQLFSWQIIISGLGLPWLGYLLAWMVAKICKQPPKDSLAIAIEAGVQNTGIAIFLLRFTLPQPEADLTTVAPVAVAMMTPLPLLLLFLYQRANEKWLVKSSEKESIMPK